MVHRLGAVHSIIFRTTFFVGKADLPLIDGYQPMGGYGYPVGVTARIVEHGLLSGKRRLGMADPVL